MTPSKMPTDRLLSAESAAELLGIRPSTIRWWWTIDKLRRVKIGRLTQVWKCDQRHNGDGVHAVTDAPLGMKESFSGEEKRSYTVMTTEQKKALLTDVSQALRALGRIDDGPHTRCIEQIPRFAHNVERLRDGCLNVMAGLSLLQAMLESEIGTDNL
jgi:hypothetical protein